MSFKVNCLRHFQLGICLEECNSISGQTGPTGPIGLSGFSTNTGATGPTGPIGLSGFSTNTGATGPTGPIGPIGIATLGAYGQLYRIDSSLTMTGRDNYVPFFGLQSININNITYTDNTASTLTILQTGIYMVIYTINGTTDNNLEILSAIFVNNNLVQNASTSISYQQNGDDKIQAVSALLSLSTGNQVTLRQTYTDDNQASHNFTIHSIQLTIIKIA